MQSWFYSKNGEQLGPVSLDELRSLASSRELNPDSDMVWTEGMADWQPPGKVPALFQSDSPTAAVASQEGFNPYAAPATSPDNLLAPRPDGSLVEIEPGSVQLEVMACIKRGFELTKRHFGTLLLIGVVYIVISFVLGAIEGVISSMLMPPAAREGEVVLHPLIVPVKLISAIISLVLGAGITRASLNISSGAQATVGNLFGEFGKMVSLIAAAFLFYSMVAVGLILLVVPGIYVALRFGFFTAAIVDRNLGPIEALKYSYRITTNNAVPLFGLFIMVVLISLAGALALLVGLIFAIPVVTLAFTLAYRYLQFGPEALRDRPRSATPVFANP